MQYTPYRPGIEQAAENIANATGGIYLGSKDFEKAKTIRPIYWLYQGRVIDSLFFKEGWIVTESKNDQGKMVQGKKPLRFENHVTEFGPQNWNKSEYKNKIRTQTPKDAAAIVGIDMADGQVKVCQFSSQSGVKALLDLTTQKDKDGNPNPLYTPSLADVDLVIKKDAEGNFTMIPKEKEGPFGPKFVKMIGQFEWSWDLFMECTKMEDGDGIKFHDVEEVMFGSQQQQQQAQKPVQKPVQQRQQPTQQQGQDLSEQQKLIAEKGWTGWRAFISKKGTVLGTCDLAQLEGFAEQLSLAKPNPVTSGPTYDAVTEGINELTAIRDGQTQAQEANDDAADGEPAF